jgi:hypothetical protein
MIRNPIHKGEPTHFVEVFKGEEIGVCDSGLPVPLDELGESLEYTSLCCCDTLAVFHIYPKPPQP